MKALEVRNRQLGENIFYIQTLPAFTAANISGEMFAIILPAIASIAPILGMETESLLDIDSEVAANALAKGASGIGGDKVERLLKMLLVQSSNISFEPVGADKSVQPQILTEDMANNIFRGDIQDMFILAFDVIKSNYGRFFEKLDSLFGDRIEDFKKLLAKAESGPINTEN